MELRLPDNEPMDLWAVYDHPDDYPHCFVARRWIVTLRGIAATEDIMLAPTLEEVRALLPPGMFRMGPSPDDDTNIVETWI